MADDDDATIFRPAPGRRRAAPAAAPAAAGPQLIVESGPNALAAKGTALLSLAARLRDMTEMSDVEALRQKVIEELKRYETAASATGASRDHVRAAHYALCATIDDIILNTPWGSRSIWARASMVTTFHGDAWGGERFFEILAQMEREPARTLDVLELMAVCMAVGFEGQCRVAPGGRDQLAAIRENLYALIRRFRGEPERALSPRWRGSEVGYSPVRATVPVWVAAVAAIAVVGVAFLAYSFLLSNRSSVAFAELMALPPLGPVQIARAGPPPEPDVAQSERLRGFLEDEIREGLVVVSETETEIEIRLVNTSASAIFASASAEVQPLFVDIIHRIGAELVNEPGQVRIEGHSDSDAINTPRFPSNYELSLARAEATRELLADEMDDPSRLSTVGLAYTDPLIDEATAADKREAQRQNRRVEIVLQRRLLLPE